MHCSSPHHTTRARGTLALPISLLATTRSPTSGPCATHQPTPVSADSPLPPLPPPPQELQDVFHTGRSDTVNLVLGNPSVLVAPLALLRTKVRDLAMLLVESHQAVVELLLRSPLLSSRSSRWLAQSIQGLAQSLQVGYSMCLPHGDMSTWCSGVVRGFVHQLDAASTLWQQAESGHLHAMWQCVRLADLQYGCLRLHQQGSQLTTCCRVPCAAEARVPCRAHGGQQAQPAGGGRCLAAVALG